MNKHTFTPSKIYNIDESGNTNVHVPRKIVACKGNKQVDSAASGERGNIVTFIAAISASGNAVPFVYIFPRVNFKPYMLKGAPADSVGTAHPSGWSNGVIFLEYFVDDKILVILDNHKSHITPEIINLDKEHGIVILTIPPHTSHTSSNPSIAVFLAHIKLIIITRAPRKKTGKPISIYDVAEISGQAYRLAFNRTNIESGFKVSRIWPVNENVFQEHEFCSSSVTDRDNPANINEDIYYSAFNFFKSYFC
ncbi:uncharacterized protein [Diabrotica undecimpunctata]|uniref:uncharacterized protein n=1 Tax=Diabrotica undecimpunctata TaxID=50387 RepID=UPI003B631E9E